MPPTPRCTNDRRTSSCSASSFFNASVSASSEPFTSAFTIRFNVATSPRWTIAKMSSRRAPPPNIIGLRCAATLRRCVRASATVRATLSDGATRSSSPASGTSSRPSTSTGTDGPASLTCWPCSSNIARTRPHAGPGDDLVADAQRAFFDQRGHDRTTTLVEVRLEHVGLGRPLRVGDEVFGDLGVGNEQQRVEQLLDPLTGRCGHVEHDRVPPHSSGTSSCSVSCWRTRRGVGVFPVGLGDRDDDRDLGGPGVVDRLDRLRHDAVVGRDHEDRDVGDLRAARTHGGERFVTRRVDERDAPTVAVDLVCTDVLGDAAGFARDDVRVPDAVEQRGLAVVDVTHDGDDGRARLEQRLVVLVVVGGEQRDQFDLLLAAGLDDQDLRAELFGDQLDHLVGERRGRRHHLARREQDAHEVGGRAIQLGCVLLDGAAARDDDFAFRDGRIRGREPLRRRFELGAVATTLLAPALRRATGPTATTRASARTATESTRSTTGTTSAPTGRAGTTGARTTRSAAATRASARRVAAATAAATTRAAEAASARGTDRRHRYSCRHHHRGRGAGHRDDSRSSYADRAAAGELRRRPGGGGIALPLPDVGRDGAVGGGVARRRTGGRSSPAAATRGAAGGGRTGGAADAAAAAGVRPQDVDAAQAARRDRRGRRAHDPVRGTHDCGLGLFDRQRRGRREPRVRPGRPERVRPGPTTAGAAGSGAGGVGAGSGSTTGSRLSPRESASRRTRSADGSSMLDEWLFTPILSSLESSTTTALSTPSSRASS